MPLEVDHVLLARPRGFCAGVEMAIKALAWMVRVFEPPVYCYHEIVHNRLVVDRFAALGVIFVDDVDEVPPGAPLMLSAHGSAPDVVAAAKNRGRFVVNAVCPLVTKVHHEAKVRVGKGYTILYVGHAGHDEAVGTLAVAPGAMRLLEHVEDVASGGGRSDQGGHAGPDDVVPQRLEGDSGPGQGPVPGSVDGDPRRPVLRHHQPSGGPDRHRHPGRRGGGHRQRQLVQHPGPGEGGRRGRLSIVQRINGAGELDVDALSGARVVGVTAGASAPEEIVQAVIAALAPHHGVEEVDVTDEDEYFPPPRELRELMPALDALVALATGGSPVAAAALGGPFSTDRAVDASDTLAGLR